MRRLLQTLAPAVHLTRLTTAFAAIGNAWFVVLWMRAETSEVPGCGAGLPGWVLLAAGSLAVLGLYTFGAALNDLLDAHRDRALRLDRPLATGQSTGERYAVTVAAALIGAGIGAAAFGAASVVALLVVAGLILLLHAGGRFVPGAGLVLISLIYAGHMLALAPGLEFLAPVWLVMTHATVVSAAAHLLARRGPPLTKRGVSAATIGWLGCTIALGVLSRERVGGLWPATLPVEAALWPGVAALVYIALAVRRVRALGAGPRAADKVARYGALWLPVYGASWLLGAGHHREAMLLGGYAVAGFLGMSVLREAIGLVREPLGYRR